MPKPPRRKHSVAEMRANPNWRKYLTDAQLTPQQRATRTRNTALKADPLAPVTTLGGLEGQAGTLVDAQQQGDVADIKAQQARADAEFATRKGMYEGLANFQTTGAQKAFGDVTNSVNAVIAANNAGSTADQGMLAAALKASDDAQRAAIANAGGAPQPTGTAPGTVPQDDTASRLAALGSTAEGIRGQVGAGATAAIGAEGAMQAIPGQQLGINMTNLTGERNQTNKELQTKRDTLTKDRKNLLRQAVRDLQDFEVAKRQYGDQSANLKFQQYLAQKQFDESVKQESFAEWLQTGQLTGVTAPGGPVPAGQTTLGGRAANTADVVAQTGAAAQRTSERSLNHQIQVDWANVHINQQNANTAYLQALEQSKNGKTAADKERGKAHAAEIAKGITAMDAYLAPRPGEGAPPSANSRFPHGTDTTATDKNGNPVTHKASQAEVDAYNKAHKADIDARRTQPMEVGQQIATAGRPYVRTYLGALKHLQSQGMSLSGALRVLSMSTYTDWATKAKHELGRVKRRKAGGVDPAPRGSSQKPGTSGAAGYGGPT